MKKTLAALSVLGAFAGSSLAADVTLYGVIDTGLVYQHADADLPDVDTVDTFQMKSGVTAGSRFGLKGTEDLGNGLKIGFVLENGFVSDTGSFTQNNRLFGREAQLNLSGAFGTVAFGRMGSLASGNGTFGLLGSLSPFGTSWGEYAANASTVMSGFDRYDNTVTYATPAFAGFKAYAQYSFDTDSKDDYDGAGLHGVGGSEVQTRSLPDSRGAEFILGTSGAVTRLSTFGLRPLATLVSKGGSDPNRNEGSAVIVREDHREFQTLGDLKGRTIAASNALSFPGWQIVLGEVAKFGINPNAFFGKTIFTGDARSISDIVKLVLDDKADAGVLRLCAYEQFIERHPEAVGELRVLDRRDNMDVACVHSTDLYPGFTMAVTELISPEAARR